MRRQIVSRTSATTQRVRSGVTLLELLIVITIMAMVTAASVPLLLSGAEQRRLRESARLVSAYFSGARSHAIEIGRPVGVMVVRNSTVNTSGGSAVCAMDLVTMETLPPYAGDTIGATATASGAQLFSINDNGSWANLVKIGDVIKLGYQGRSYMLTGTTPISTFINGVPYYNGSVQSFTSAGQLLSSTGFPGTPMAPVPCYLYPTDNSGVLPPALAGVPFQVFRQPVRSAVQPLQLPEGFVIDLAPPGNLLTPPVSNYPGTSGAGSSVFTGGVSGAYTSPIVMFSPTGGVDSVYDGNSIYHPTSPIFFLVGRRAGAIDVAFNTSGTQSNMTSIPPSPLPPGWTPNNLFDLNNIWISIGSVTGLVATSDNANITAAGSALGLSSSASQQSSNWLSEARLYAQSAQSMGGR